MFLAALSTSRRNPFASESGEPSSNMPPSMQRPRCSMKLPNILGSISEITRSVSILMRAAVGIGWARAAQEVASNAVVKERRESVVSCFILNYLLTMILLPSQAERDTEKRIRAADEH